MNRKEQYTSIAVFVFTATVLSAVQLNVKRPILLVERFWPGAGWVEIILVAAYAAFLFAKMQSAENVARMRKLSWSLFALVFFSQLILGLFGFEQFLMTGELHLPVPAVIIGGPIYRAEIGFMSILFLSTVLLSGPAWCSHLCYFGALDNLLAGGKGRRKGLRYAKEISLAILFLIIFGALFMRIIGASANTAAWWGGGFGLFGLLIILIISRKRRLMIHCTAYCPVGTLINYISKVNPFRMYIDRSCTFCNRCTSSCLYDALKPSDIKTGKPGLSCTLCGDCVSSCHVGSIKYKFFRMKPENARMLYLFITVSLHAVFLALARI